MSLRAQLLAFGLLTLILPWAGLRFVQEMESVLREGLESSLLGNARTVASAVDGHAALIDAASAGSPAGPGPVVYAHPLTAAPRIDGFRGDWGATEERANGLGARARYWAGVYERFAYLYLAVDDADVVRAPSPGQTPYGDRPLLMLRPRAGATEWLVLTSSAPGPLRAQRTRPPSFVPSGDLEERVVADWRDTATGYGVEVRIPLNMLVGGLGIGVIGVDGAGSGYDVSTTSTWVDPGDAPGPFLYRSPELQSLVGQFAGAGRRFRLTNDAGWVLADAGGLDAAVEPADRGLAGRFFRMLLHREDPPYEGFERPPGRLAVPLLDDALAGAAATAWYGSGSEGGAIVAAAAPVRSSDAVIGAVVLEQTSAQILSLTNQAVLRLMTSTLLVSLIAGAALLGYATYLSVRVRRLAKAAETALGPKGEIETALPGRGAKDEIGDLARSFGGLLTRLREHTDYLRTLTSKLSHELRTPLAIVSTSLDNIEQERSDVSDVYLKRLRHGAERLDAIVVAMSEATRMEHAISETEPEDFDLHLVLAACCQAYPDVYPNREFAYSSAVDAAPVTGSRELVEQMMDKLIDNAAEFSPSGGRIDVRLSATKAGFAVEVVNRGSRLPAAMGKELFESLVSVREKSGDRPHLGLGLYVVALIADFHGGTAEAENLDDGSGVVFRVSVPRARRRA